MSTLPLKEIQASATSRPQDASSWPNLGLVVSGPSRPQMIDSQ